MSVLVVGLSHRTAPLDLLERVTLDAGSRRRLEAAAVAGEHVAEALVLSTCNRLEVYAEVEKFHGGIADVGTALSQVTGVPLEELTEHLYVHYEDAAVHYLFTVVCGLDSMAVGETQILGQVRGALKASQEPDGDDAPVGAFRPRAGRVLGQLVRHALRVGKRAHTETNLDRAGLTLVEAGMAEAAELIGPLQQANVLVVGAGSMGALSAATLQRAGIRSVVVANRTPERARRLADQFGAVAADLTDLPGLLAEADLVIAAAGAPGYLITADDVAAGWERRDAGRPQVFVDLALPRDVDPDAERQSGVTVLDLAGLGRHLASNGLPADVEQVRTIIDGEVAVYRAGQHAQAVAPTVVALRAHAASVVESELARLESRLSDVDPRVRAELEQTVHRVVEKLLHTPTVRVKELAAEPGGGSYAEALRELFGLGPQEATSVQGPRTGVLDPRAMDTSLRTLGSRPR